MGMRLVLRAVDGGTVVRDVVGGKWAEVEGDSDLLIGDDLWALPGLFDGHAHLAGESMDFEAGDIEGAKARAAAAMRGGVLLVLDKGWGDSTTIRLIDEVDEADRPTIEAAARMLAVECGYITGFAREVSPGGVGPAVAAAAAEGRGWVKLIGDWPRKGVGPVANFSEDELRMAVEMAAMAGSRVAVHTMARDVPGMAVRAGAHSIDHGLFLEPGDLMSLGARGGIWVPTVLRMEAVIRQLGAESSGGLLLREGLANVSRLLPIAVEAGVKVLAGTDLATPTRQVAEEAIRLAEMGLSPRAAVDAVSYSGFQALDMPEGFPIGGHADAVLYGANPLDELAVLEHPEMVLRRGRIVS